mmetsp:Transcript_12910/g.15771  ORF Transcript_12910/g.15771 Transcript_12910/m.15771 type:complete len:86 (+) Transcript_12910:52-309(+)
MIDASCVSAHLLGDPPDEAEQYDEDSENSEDSKGEDLFDHEFQAKVTAMANKMSDRALMFKFDTPIKGVYLVSRLGAYIIKSQEG